jgi:phage terminase Nu1 subunit (DNA packaging protein)
MKLLKLSIAGAVTLALAAPAPAGESKILSTAAKYLPNLTEVAYITNIVNVYVQMSQYVRSTNHLIRNIEEAKTQWTRTGQQLEDLYEDVQALKNINLYDMDSWAQTLENANNIVLIDIAEIRHSFDMTEYYSLDASVEYLDAISDANHYDIRTAKNRETVEGNFVMADYRKAVEEFRLAAAGYRLNTLQVLRARLQEEQANLGNAGDPGQQINTAMRILNLTKQVSKIESQMRSVPGSITKLDSIVDLASDLISVNLTEMQYASQRLQSYEKAAAALRESYQRLANGEIQAKAKTKTAPTPEVPFELNKYSATDPNNVPVPKTPDPVAISPTRIKAVSEQDILALQNQIDFTALVQESLLRDIQMMKGNTMAFILALEAYKQDMAVQKSYTTAHAAKMMEIAVRDRK